LTIKDKFIVINDARLSSKYSATSMGGIESEALVTVSDWYTANAAVMLT